MKMAPRENNGENSENHRRPKNGGEKRGVTAAQHRMAMKIKHREKISISSKWRRIEENRMKYRHHGGGA
jgi:hypothetical protein